jgi:hypothetical protein
MNPTVISALVGSVVGIFSGWIGISGSVYIELALLVTGLANTQSKAAGTTLFAMMFPISTLAVYEYYKKGNIDIKNGLIICLFYTILAGVGAKLNGLFSQQTTLYIAGGLNAIASVIFFYQGYKQK